MLGLAASGVITYSGNIDDKHCTNEQQKRVWQQYQSHADCCDGKQPRVPVQNHLHQNDNEDPIIHVARQLSRLASRQDHNTMDEMYRQSLWQQRTRPRSASMEHPTSTRHTSRKRFRSQSAHTAAKATSPPPPVGVTVTKHQLQEQRQQNRPPTRLRYVSTWK